MRNVVLAVCLAGCCVSHMAPTTPVVTPPSPVFEIGAAALLQIEVYDLKRRGYLTGSGAVIGHDHKGAQIILTAGHLYEDIKEPLTVVETTEDGLTHERQVGVLAACDPKRDLALVKLVRPVNVRELSVSRVEPATFETLYMFGNPDGAPRTVGTAVLSAKHVASSQRPHHLWQLTGFAWPGSSGGPVLDGTGQVVSVILAIDQVHDPDSDDPDTAIAVPDITFSSPWTELTAFLKEQGEVLK